MSTSRAIQSPYTNNSIHLSKSQQQKRSQLQEQEKPQEKSTNENDFIFYIFFTSPPSGNVQNEKDKFDKIRNATKSKITTQLIKCKNHTINMITINYKHNDKLRFV
eukprot:TRINITY_DN780_c1_g1_i1.p1 TRINITY_DN780_c1_g1~~TRINITY_DN780_c1_g1_i1.p1  ORF type:complete len:106 (-),score=10.56 TRINITY_DN780_c1_g1_i1:181-498(-)